MDFYAINGAAINGTSVSPLTASANFVLLGEISAVATRVVNAAAAITGGADAGVTPTHIQAATADALGTVEVYTTPQHTQAASAEIEGSVSILAAVYRKVFAEATIECFVDFQAIPASTLADAHVAAGADLAASATKVQPGRAAMPCTVGVAAAPTVTRYVAAQVLGTISLRVEAQRNETVDGYADAGGTVSLTTPDSGIVLRQGAAYLDQSDNLVAIATYMHASASALIDAACDMTANAVSIAVPFAFMNEGVASFVAQPIRIVLPAASFPVGADMTPRAMQYHASGAQIDDDVDVRLAPTLYQATAAVVSEGDAAFTATGLVHRRSPADIALDVTLVADPVRTTYGAAAVDVPASVTIEPTQLCMATVDGVITAEFEARAAVTRMAGADAAGSAAITADALRTTFGVAALDPVLDFAAFSTLRIQAAVALAASVEVSADARLNIEAFDTEENTMYRPPEDTEFVRPFEEFEMRRAA